MPAPLISAAHAAGAVLADAMPRPDWDPNPIPSARLIAPAPSRAGILSSSAIRQIRSEREAAAAADAELACAYRATETLAGLLDRHAGDAGCDPDALASITDRITALAEDVLVLLGQPARAIRATDGEIVALVREAR